MAIINRLLVNFNYKFIDDSFDFYMITTKDNYIKRGAYILDKPVDKLKALSLAYENGRNAFIMFKKNTVSKSYLSNEITDEIISVSKVLSNEIKDYILFRLFIYSMNNYDSSELSFNNLTGKLYIYSSSWMSNNRNSFKALRIDVDQEMHILLEATSFTKLSLFNEKIKKDYLIPKYQFSANNSLKRNLNYDDASSVYIRKPLYNTKAEIPFLDLSDLKKKTTKIYYMYWILDLLKDKYNKFFTFTLDEKEVKGSIGKIKDKKFLDKAIQEISDKEINIVNLIKVQEYSDEFNILCEKFQSTFKIVKISNEIKEHALNVVFIHNKEYYSEKGYNDPYKEFKRDCVIQCVTYEDSVNKIINDNEVIFNTIIKELAIKNEIINEQRFIIDDWQNYNYTENYVFGKEKDGMFYFMKIKPNGEFYFEYKLDDFRKFKDEQFEECANILSCYKGKEKTIISDCNSNILLLSRTNMYCLPNKSVLEKGNISRSKESRLNNLSGIVDINLFNYNDLIYFNSGIVGSGMKYGIPKASLLYKVDVIKGKNIFMDLLNTLSVSFVKYNSFTVLPYPIKYLNEYINMISNNKK